MPSNSMRNSSQLIQEQHLLEFSEWGFGLWNLQTLKSLVRLWSLESTNFSVTYDYWSVESINFSVTRASLVFRIDKLSSYS